MEDEKKNYEKAKAKLKKINASMTREFLKRVLTISVPNLEKILKSLGYSVSPLTVRNAIQAALKGNDDQILSFITPYLSILESNGWLTLLREEDMLLPQDSPKIPEPEKEEDNDDDYELPKLPPEKFSEKDKPENWRYTDSENLYEYYLPEKSLTTIKNVYLGLRRLVFGPSHYAPILELSDGKFAVVNFGSSTIPLVPNIANKGIRICDTLEEAAFSMGGFCNKVRLSNYGPPSSSQKYFVNYLTTSKSMFEFLNDSIYLLGDSDCQNFSRREIKRLTGKWVGFFPLENGRKIKFKVESKK